MRENRLPVRQGITLHEGPALSVSLDRRSITISLHAGEVEQVAAALARYRSARDALTAQGGRRGGGPAGPQGSPVAGRAGLLGLTASVFTAPGFALFTDLLAGWVLTPGRRTITRMLTVADPHHRRAHDAYHRFIRARRWDMTALWRVLAVHAVDLFAPGRGGGAGL